VTGRFNQINGSSLHRRNSWKHQERTRLDERSKQELSPNPSQQQTKNYDVYFVTKTMLNWSCEGKKQNTSLEGHGGGRLELSRPRR
jgi:hypothetical protein